MIDRARVIWLTARRAGLRRVLARARRIFLLRLVYPRFGSPLFPLRNLTPPNIVAPPTIELLPLSVREKCAWDGHLHILNTKPFAMRPPVDWNANPIGHALWAFRLHEWEWAYPLIRRAVDDAEAAQELEALGEDYWKHSSGVVRLEPYPLSRRLVVWSVALRVLCARGGAEGFTRTLASEIDRGARMLARNIEHDLDNNHVIANARALAFAGTLLGQPYAKKGYALMWEQLRAQVRADGTHIENSTSYHFLVWRDARETCELAREYNIPVPSDIPPRLDLMEKFLAALRYPDGTFPMLNDSVEVEGLEIRDWRLAAVSIFQDSGYAVLRQGETWVIFDAGALGPPYCPGHGHADTLSFELSARGRVRIVDPGVYQYEAGSERDYFRSTAAHSTLEVDGLNSSEVFGSFRVGRLANTRLDVQVENGITKLHGEHDGYARLKNPVWHARTLELQDECTLVITDEIRGHGLHDYTLRFHLAPCGDVSAQKNRAHACFGDGVELEFEIPDAPNPLQVQEGWTSRTWYEKCAAPVIALQWRGEAPQQIRTVIHVQR